MLCRELGQAGLGDRPISKAIISCVRHAGVFWAPASSLPSYRFTPRGYVRVVSQGIGSARPPWGALPARLPTSPWCWSARDAEWRVGVCQADEPPMHPLALVPLWPRSLHPLGVISPKNGRKRVPKAGEG